VNAKTRIRTGKVRLMNDGTRNAGRRRVVPGERC
jgi:hypothetical protein